ncbi:MAG: tRNA (adenosine(37)-N6)-dimethylallyltransferase MiaA [Verrucomicrobia bacterium]|nr:MAG: tRNA (adenosine(37)-N6)-dimethylallyltransferase MiaA [Verrucomicrobiota bacterium]
MGATARRAVELMTRVFFVVGPTATGKSELAADLAHDVDAEIVNSDAFQIYRGLDLLTAKPDQATRAKAPHHLIGTMSIREEMNAEKFRCLALATLDEIHSRKKVAIVVGGSGLYIKALTHGLSDLPQADPSLRTQLNRLTLDQLRARLVDLDPKTVDKIDIKNRRRLVRALEICLMTGRPASAQRTKWKAVGAAVASGTGKRVQDATRSAPKAFGASTGVLVFRDRDELYQRINQRVKAMFQNGVIEEVRATGAMSETASKMIGLREIRELLDGKMSILQCVAQIQQASRRYAKRQLTWFRRQTNFEPLNLSLLSHNEAVKWISQRASRSLAQGND